VALPPQTTTSSGYRSVAAAFPVAATRIVAALAPTTSIGTLWNQSPFTPGSTPAERSWLAMYSDARRPPRVAGARPSRRSELRKRRAPSISAVVMRERACAAANAGVTRNTNKRSERMEAIGTLREREMSGQYTKARTP
jgi:hypothetical protein